MSPMSRAMVLIRDKFETCVMVRLQLFNVIEILEIESIIP